MDFIAGDLSSEEHPVCALTLTAMATSVLWHSFPLAPIRDTNISENRLSTASTGPMRKVHRRQRRPHRIGYGSGSGNLSAAALMAIGSLWAVALGSDA